MCCRSVAKGNCFAWFSVWITCLEKWLFMRLSGIIATVFGTVCDKQKCLKREMIEWIQLMNFIKECFASETHMNNNAKWKWVSVYNYNHSFSLYTQSNKNPSAWNFLSTELEVTWRTVAIIIWVVLLSPCLCICGCCCWSCLKRG